jgi:hypothetical protein
LERDTAKSFAANRVDDNPVILTGKIKKQSHDFYYCYSDDDPEARREAEVICSPEIVDVEKQDRDELLEFAVREIHERRHGDEEDE